MATYRYYSIKLVGRSWQIVGWSRTADAAAARGGRVVNASSRAMAARKARDQFGIEVSNVQKFRLAGRNAAGRAVIGGS
jgi:hypothetical protein